MSIPYISGYAFSFDILFATDMNDLTLPKTVEMKFPNPDNMLEFELYISPDEVRFVRLRCSISFCFIELTNSSTNKWLVSVHHAR